MRTPIVAIWLICLIALETGCTVGSQPAPSPGLTMLSGRVEVPAYGFALTFPGSWAVDPDGTREWGEADPDQGPYSALTAWDEPMESVDAAHCNMWVDSSIQPPISLAEYAQLRIHGFERDPDITGSYLPIWLPAGQGIRTTYVYDYDFVLGHSEYILERDGLFYTLSCIGEDPPADGWRSIAKTWEWLPAA